METVAFCEIEEFPRKVLKKHWPDVPCYTDIRELTGERLKQDGITAELICGGWPCQPFSVSGKRAGKGDDRHLWPEYLRLIREIKPRWIIGENVAGHISMGLDDVLSDLESEGYTWEAFIIPACAVDAPHRRDRVWVVAHAELKRRRAHAETEPRTKTESKELFSEDGPTLPSDVEAGGGSMAKTSQLFSDGKHNHSRKSKGQISEPGDNSSENHAANTKSIYAQGLHNRQRERKFRGGCRWPAEPPVGRVANGVPRELDLYRGLINEQGDDKKADSEALREPRWRLLRAMWKHRAIAKASPDIYRQRLRDCLPEVSHEDSHGGWYLGAWIEESKGLRDLWEAFYSKSFQEAQDLQQELLERIRKIERTKEVGPSKSRVDRLRSLGNAVVPQIPEIIGRAIMEVERA